MGLTETPARATTHDYDYAQLLKKKMSAMYELYADCPPCPPNVMHRDGYSGPVCPRCRSDYPRKYWLFGARRCIRAGCEHDEQAATDRPSHIIREMGT